MENTISIVDPLKQVKSAEHMEKFNTKSISNRSLFCNFSLAPKRKICKTSMRHLKIHKFPFKNVIVLAIECKSTWKFSKNFTALVAFQNRPEIRDEENKVELLEGYLSLRFSNMVKVNIHEHWTRVTRFNLLWVSDQTQSTFEMTPGFKPFAKISDNFAKKKGMYNTTR